jgi:uncharacterized protein (TIGR02145 family)
MRTKILVLFTLLLSANLHAQVSIGELTGPATGALLDLNKTTKGGLLLSNVSIEDLSKIPHSTPNLFPGINGANDDTNNDFKGALVYHTGTSLAPAGIYAWNGTNWTPIGENCLPVDSLTVTLTSSAVVAKTGNPVTFSVSSNAGTRCAEGETYDWYQAAAAGSYGAAGTTVYPTSSKSIAFSPANIYKVKVEASNIYSTSSAKATSNEVTVYVTDDAGVPATLYGDNYDVVGSPCYDIGTPGVNEPEAGYTARADSFASGYGKTYLFDYKESYSDLQVNCEDPHGLVDHIVQPVNKSNLAASGKEPFTVVFKSDVKTSVPVSGRDTVKLWVSYKVGTEAKLILRNIRVQDAACHCPARIDRLSDRWLTFACHNLGGSDITSSSQSLTYQHHGDWYRWGAKTASVQNLDATTDANPAVWNYEGNASPPYTPYYQDSPTYGSGVDWFTANNPCPAGWRLPDIDELAGIMNYRRPNSSSTSFSNISPVNNTLDYSEASTWTTDSNDKTHFSAYVKVGDYLYLPTAGYRRNTTGLLSHRGFHSAYWSSSAQSSEGWYLSGSRWSVNMHYYPRAYGFSVRCVAAE